mmetsp:Transcript_108153/g.161794  ORF Transcript_108153/g.161794 Transcript_108153/m.161794 type:complete len:134 (+) Transcript_108153:16-417(+)|eukprot:CAMPEP_0117036112 /NCGR_PEP_ID=MMETSP0472-20121206/25605_1 /TAXON_ID=693140 ORGANISM="Tiarina fusus, Strain LIS" /NCGR_SAMPLE_ID=MMETSP0472 /ASSEMBLY_ACC=CAM_ASM_000603 /LENGTH=133 /DNA_ID=CAMNT_0004745781 /DNA_START=14 /DNA_END=415 /DNA_ORIENTATION=-
MGFTRFVEVGRVALINYGPSTGKLCTIIDIVDQQRVLIDGPFDETGVHRQVISCKRLSLTDIKVQIPRCAKEKRIVDAWKADKVTETWEASSWAKRLSAKKRRASLSDFDRFKVMIAKKQKAKLVAEKLSTLA